MNLLSLRYKLITLLLLRTAWQPLKPISPINATRFVLSPFLTLKVNTIDAQSAAGGIRLTEVMATYRDLIAQVVAEKVGEKAASPSNSDEEPRSVCDEEGFICEGCEAEFPSWALAVAHELDCTHCKSYVEQNDSNGVGSEFDGNEPSCSRSKLAKFSECVCEPDDTDNSVQWSEWMT